MKFRKFMGSMLSDNANVSSKRVIAVVAFIFLCIGFWMDITLGIKVNEFVWNSLLYIVLGGLGLTSIEKFRSNSYNKGAAADDTNENGAAKKTTIDEQIPITINEKIQPIDKPVQESTDDVTDADVNTTHI